MSEKKHHMVGRLQISPQWETAVESIALKGKETPESKA